MPRLWTATIDEHRRSVREAILEAAAALVLERGVRAVTMSEIADTAGIGRATLYKYFADVGAILRAWHEREIRRHLDELGQIRDEAPEAGRLEAVLRAYASIRREAHSGHAAELAALLHADGHSGWAETELVGLVEQLVREAAAAGRVRGDVPAGELAHYCVQALAAAGGVRSHAAVRRLVDVTLSGLTAR